MKLRQPLAGFLPIIKLQSWVRRDGLSLDFHAGEPPTSRMWPTWARGVFVEFFYVLSYFRSIVISMDEGAANASCPGRFRSRGRPSRGLGGIIDGQKVDTRNEGATF